MFLGSLRSREKMKGVSPSSFFSCRKTAFQEKRGKKEKKREIGDQVRGILRRARGKRSLFRSVRTVAFQKEEGKRTGTSDRMKKGKCCGCQVRVTHRKEGKRRKAGELVQSLLHRKGGGREGHRRLGHQERAILAAPGVGKGGGIISTPWILKKKRKKGSATVWLLTKHSDPDYQGHRGRAVPLRSPTRGKEKGKRQEGGP